MSKEDNRPAWPYEISEDDMYLLGCFITGIRHKRAMIDIDKSESWIELQAIGSEEWRKMPGTAMQYVNFDPIHWSSLFSLTYKGREALKRLEEIKKWEEKNKRERREYERLKKKFG